MIGSYNSKNNIVATPRKNHIVAASLTQHGCDTSPDFVLRSRTHRKTLLPPITGLVLRRKLHGHNKSPDHLAVGTHASIFLLRGCGGDYAPGLPRCPPDCPRLPRLLKFNGFSLEQDGIENRRANVTNKITSKKQHSCHESPDQALRVLTFTLACRVGLTRFHRCGGKPQ